MRAYLRRTMGTSDFGISFLLKFFIVHRFKSVHLNHSEPEYFEPHCDP